ncbi:alpha/beta-hydrolase [Phanerochaete sordida]|uniref:Alpha/beta-hydrolase n=1 Tax=Phanerochaete sordida TaxID=48140 RepID=A0A9P3LL94_9APHY|nr:alpha/beta-hydrolase [Phanerochaete sordida]
MTIRLRLGAVALALCLTGLAAAKTLHRRDETFDWMNLTASTNLTLVPCYGQFECARLTVPLQYSNASAGEAQIAMLVIPAAVPRDDPAYLGPLLFNPGGPGNSGVQYALQEAANFSLVLGRNYDIVGFDPRGVGFTTPPLAFFESPAEALEFFAPYPFSANDSASSLGRIFAQSRILSDLADTRAGAVAESVSTPTVALDMLSIVRAFGREKLSFYGVSYGSLLGATFAAMFPDKIERMALDGIVNAHEWYQGTSYVNASLTDTEAVLDAVYTSCVGAGPSACPIFEASPALVRARVERAIAAAQAAPVPVYNASSGAFAVVDGTLVAHQLFEMLYTPYTSALPFARAVAALETGDGSLMLPGSEAAIVDAYATCAGAGRPFSAGFLDVGAAITCGDSLVAGTRTVDQARAEYERMAVVSGQAAAWYPLSQGICAGWSIRGKDRLNGSFETNTSFPILFISNALDPVLAVTNAHNMSAGFSGSVVLTQNATGHTSQSGFAPCTALALNAYFDNGTLPSPGTVCQSEEQIFSSAES